MADTRPAPKPKKDTQRASDDTEKKSKETKPAQKKDSAY
jgi:hypothetical protein